MRVIIDPRLKFNYASWLLLGIEQVFGKENISFNVSPFKSLFYSQTQEYNSGFAFIINNKDIVYKVFVDTEDQAIIFDDRYKWCDVYAMINPTHEQVETYNKLMPIGPQCGITLDTKTRTVFTCVANYLRGYKHTAIPFKLYLRDYLYTNIRRRPITDYSIDVPISENYIFHASTLWYNQFAATDTNMYRGEFLKACQKAGLQIEGGLYYIEGDAPVEEMPSYPQYKEIYKDFIYNSRLTMDEYIKKTKQSAVVFNTPSVCECHGWKLAEYLCMGKAIISTPLKREMPGEGLVHGENVHFVSSVEEIYDAVVKISSDREYREKLEHNAKKYYDKWLSPQAVILRIADNFGIKI